MKTKVELCDICHEDLVNLFSTALYGSTYLECDYHVWDNDDVVTFKERDCFEDKIARCLLSGKQVVMIDHEAEDESEGYGELDYYWDTYYNCMCYPIGLDDIKQGVEKMLDGDDTWLRRCARAWVYEQDDFDLEMADTIIQYIMFGEVIYG